jgi:hypothetical protein
MDDPPGRKPEAIGRLGVTRGAATELGAGHMQITRARRPVNRPVDATAPGEGLVRGVHDRVHLLQGDVASRELKPHLPSERLFVSVMA